MKYPAARHWPSFSSMNVTVSVADGLFANTVSNCITTYCPSGAPGSGVADCALFTLRDVSLPSGLRTVSKDVFHLSSVTALRKKADACCPLLAESPWSFSPQRDLLREGRRRKVTTCAN